MAEETGKLIEFFELANRLKTNKRTGWAERKIPACESIADHSFRLALMALVFAEKLGIDSARAVKMALVHDLAEAITGDIQRDHIDDYENSLGIKPSITKEQKSDGEKKALKQIVGLLDKKSAKEILSLCNEYNERKTKTARIVKELDGVECMMQAIEYKRAFPENEPLDDFYFWYKKFGKIEIPELKKIVDKIMGEFEGQLVKK